MYIQQKVDIALTIAFSSTEVFDCIYVFFRGSHEKLMLHTNCVLAALNHRLVFEPSTFQTTHVCSAGKQCLGSKIQLEN